MIPAPYAPVWVDWFTELFSRPAFSLTAGATGMFTATHVLTPLVWSGP